MQDIVGSMGAADEEPLAIPLQLAACCSGTLRRICINRNAEGYITTHTRVISTMSLLRVLDALLLTNFYNYLYDRTDVLPSVGY